MAIEAQLADGRVLEFPDGTDPSVIQATVRRLVAQSAPKPEQTILGNVKELAKGVLPGAVGLVESAATGASALLPEAMEKTAREKIKSVATAAKEPFAAATGYEESVGRRLGEGLGSIVPAVPLAFMGAPGVVAGIGMGLASGAGEARTRAEQENATAEQRSRATAMGTIPGGFDTAIDMALAALPGGVGKSLSVLRRALVSGGIEGATEAAQAIAQNAIAKGVYKPNQALLEGSGEEGAYGAGVGALASVLLDMAIPGRRGAKSAPPPPAPKAEPGPQIAPEAPVGTQGTLFTEEEMGKKVPTPKEAPEPTSAAVQQGQQLDLGLDFQRDYADLVKEREALKQQPQTAEVKARVKDLNDQILSLHESEVASIRAEKQTDAEARSRFPAIAEAPKSAQQSLFPETEALRPDTAIPEPVRRLTRGQEEARRRLEELDAQAAADVAQKLQERKGGQYRLPLRSVPEGKDVRRDLPIPARPTEITQQDLDDIGVPMRTSKKWLEQNVLGKTPAEIQVLVGNNPDLLLGTGSRAQILKYLTAPVPEGFVEEPNVAPITQTNKPKPVNQPRRSQPSVGVSGQPAVPNVVQPGTRVPTTAAAPATPDGRGLAPAGQPVGTGATTQGTQPTAVAPDVESIPSFPVGPSRITPKAIARDKPVYHETNTTGLDDLLRYDGQFEYSGAFVSNNADLALGQGNNTGVFIEFRPNSISGKVNPKIGTSPETGQEYKTDVIAPKAVNAVTIKAGTKFNPRPATRRILTAEFDKTTLPDGSIQYVRKGTSPSLALPITWSPNAPASAAPTSSAAAPAVPAAKPTVAAKPTPKAAPAKKVEAPAPAKPAEAVEIETADEEAARKAEAEDVKRRLEEVERKLKERPAPKAAPAPAPKAEKPEPKELPEKLREPVGTSEIGMEEGEKEILRGPQGMLFPMSKREEVAYAERKGRGEAAPEEEAPTAKDDRQAELDLQPRKENPDWAVKAATNGRVFGEIIYADADVALIKYADSRTGQAVYGVAAKKLGTYVSSDSADTYSNFGKTFTDAQLDKLRDEQKKAMAEDAKLALQYPDGPFTGESSNIVAGDSVDSRYADYLRELTKSLGMGDVRIFLFHSEDVAKPNAVNDLHLHGRFYTPMARAKPGDSQVGAAAPFGPTGKDFVLFFRKGDPEAETLEVLAHELGHIIDRVAFKNAPAATQRAVMDEYDDWLDSLKGKKVKDLIMSLRNRKQAESMEAEGKIPDIGIDKIALADRQYWLGFSEWFADNVSRWSTTSAKPLTITEKFFSKVAQMMRDLVAIVTGRKFPPAKAVADFLDAMGPGSADTWLQKASTPAGNLQPLQNAMSSTYTAQDVVNSMGPLTPTDKRGLKDMIVGVQKEGDPTKGVKFRVAAVDSAAAIEEKFSRTFNGAVRDNMGKINPMGLYRQAQDYSKILLEYFQNGTLTKDKATGLYRAVGTADGAPSDVFPMIYAWGEKTGRTNEEAEQYASRVLEAKRLDEVLKVNPDFPKHINDRDRAVLVAEYNSDPVYAKLNAAMDKPRIALIEKMVEVGRLSKEKAEEWKSVVGYVPFDRIDDFSEKFSMTKKTTGRSPLALTKDPELVGSFKRPVGNVFENYLNTMGWMVGQVMNNDARVQTLRGLEDLGFTGKASRVPGTEGKTAKAFINGEAMYWELPSRYDVAAFQDLNPPKMAIMRTLGAFSNILRKSVTILPPFALKQVTDDVQRAMLTSGVKNPGALLRMSLANFGKLAVAELRGIQHPIVKEFGALGLTGEYDFQQGKPAVSLLQDLGYRQREALGSKTLGTILHRLDGITRASDLAVRKAIYEQTLNESNNDMLLAQSRAREFINFRRRGASETIAIATATIPFFNAYVQGMDVLYRAASGKDSSSSVGRAQARQLFWSRAGTVAALSTMYALIAGDDDDYKDMDLRTRNSNWILPGGYKIPVPGELGAIFKVIPETVIEYLRRSGTPEEQTALEAIRASAKYMSEQYIERTVPIPQAVKPLIEAWTNYSFFTGRELEGIYQKQQDPSMRLTSKTSELAQVISNFSRDVIGVDAVSPIQIDNMLSGYLGSTAALVTMMTDSLLNPTRIDRPLHKYALLSNYMYDPIGTRSLTEFYDEREKVGKANNTLRQLMKTDIDRAEAYAEAHIPELTLESAINSTLEQLERTRAYRKFLNSPDGAAEMSKAERETDLEELKRMEVDLTRWLREAKTEIRKLQ